MVTHLPTILCDRNFSIEIDKSMKMHIDYFLLRKLTLAGVKMGFLCTQTDYSK
jgi:hypothetical protein